MEDHLRPYRAEIADAPRDVVGQAALPWKCLYGTFFTYLEKNPGGHVRRHPPVSLMHLSARKGNFR